jgi:hypothetical protein
VLRLLSASIRLGDVADINQAISVTGNAVQLVKDEDSFNAAYLASLGNAYLGRLECLGDIVDIDHAISNHGVAVRRTQDDHPSKADNLNNLGNSFATHFERLGEVEDIDRAICNSWGCCSAHSRRSSGKHGPFGREVTK